MLQSKLSAPLQFVNGVYLCMAEGVVNLTFPQTASYNILLYTSAAEEVLLIII